MIGFRDSLAETASCKLASLAPPGSTIGSPKRLDQDTTQLRHRTGDSSQRHPIRSVFNVR